MKINITRSLPFLILLTIILASFIHYYIRNNSHIDHNQTITKPQIHMNTVVSLSINGPDANKGLERSFEEIERIDNLMSKYLKSSDTWNINQHAGKDYVKVSEETIKILKASEYFYNKTNGAFDITVGPLSELWGFNDENHRIPTEEEIQEVLSVIGFDKATIDYDNSKVKLGKKDMAIDLGAVGKGYAADNVYNILMDLNINYALINIGESSIRVLGDKHPDRPWRIGILHPRKPGQYIGVIDLNDGDALSTSGDYQNFFEVDGIKYFHIFDPHTGKPPRDIIAVTALAPSAQTADIISTAVMVMGPEEGMKLIEDLIDVEAVVYTHDEQILLSPGLKGRFEHYRP